MHYITPRGSLLGNTVGSGMLDKQPAYLICNGMSTVLLYCYLFDKS